MIDPDNTRRAPTRKPPGPDYLLRVTDSTGRVMWHQTIDVRGFMSATDDQRLAWKFRGAGLASALRALTGRGYSVEKVLCQVGASKESSCS
jgi:hypothetical protein